MKIDILILSKQTFFFYGVTQLCKLTYILSNITKNVFHVALSDTQVSTGGVQKGWQDFTAFL